MIVHRQEKPSIAEKIEVVNTLPDNLAKLVFNKVKTNSKQWVEGKNKTRYMEC